MRRSNVQRCSDGDVAIVRVSESARKRSIYSFMQAVDARRAWFRSHGFFD